ncbi:hypothetical protein L7F22_022243 [Adiantum nelumboides]|nr:hypothetical protein [Adiantum nelumboides]
MLASPTTSEDDSSIDIILRATPLMLAGSTISCRERYAGGPLAPRHGMLVRKDINQKPIPEPLSHISERIWTAEKKVGLAIMLLSSETASIMLQTTLGGKVRWPETAGELAEIKAGFQALRGLPNCYGAIDATYINIHLPKNETNESWYDRYGNYNMLVQGIVDANMRFLDVNIGWLGSCNDKRVLQNFGFYRLCQGRERLAGPSFIHENLSIQEYIVGDGGYVLLPWLLIPFHGLCCNLPVIVVRSPDLLTLPSIIQACCILHNMLMDLANEREAEVGEIDVSDPLQDNPFVSEVGDEVSDTREGIEMRESMREYLDVQGLTD